MKDKKSPMFGKKIPNVLKKKSVTIFIPDRELKEITELAYANGVSRSKYIGMVFKYGKMKAGKKSIFTIDKEINK